MFLIKKSKNINFELMNNFSSLIKKYYYLLIQHKDEK